MNVGRIGFGEAAPRLHDRGGEHDATADLLPLAGPDQIRHRQRRTQIDGDTPRIEVIVDLVERYGPPGQHGDVADRSADGADVIRPAKVVRRINLNDVAPGFPRVDDFGGRRSIRDAEQVVLDRVFDDPNIRMRRDKTLGTGAARQGGFVRTADGAGGEGAVIW